MGGEMRILAIDTSCDETAAAVTDGTMIFSNSIWSQASQHASWGGVVPSLAKRLHAERIDWVIEQALRRAKSKKRQIGAIAVTVGPGLAPALEVGIARAKALALEWHVPLVAINHLEGHVLSSLAAKKKQETERVRFPALALIVSGKNTELIAVEKIGTYRILAQAIDDALGEALDKAARMLGLGYPGGAVLERLARDGNPSIYALPLPMLGREDQGMFSFSGLKTAFYRIVQEKELDKQMTCDLAASFQNKAFEHTLRIISRIVPAHPVQDLLVGGGVACNVALRKRLRVFSREHHMRIHFPYSKRLCTDNAAMIGVAARWVLGREAVARTKEEIEKIDRMSNLNFDQN